MDTSKSTLCSSIKPLSHVMFSTTGKECSPLQHHSGIVLASFLSSTHFAFEPIRSVVEMAEEEGRRAKKWFPLGQYQFLCLLFCFLYVVWFVLVCSEV